MLGDYDIKFPSEMGLPVRFMAKVPILLSAQGTLKPDGRNGLKSDVAFELDWKQSSELRTELPFNGNYIVIKSQMTDCKIQKCFICLIGIRLPVWTFAWIIACPRRCTSATTMAR